MAPIDGDRFEGNLRNGVDAARPVFERRRSAHRVRDPAAEARSRLGSDADDSTGLPSLPPVRYGQLSSIVGLGR